jgi:DNA polymerase-3 subunit gamma/tau
LLGEEINLDCVRGAVRDVLGVEWRVRVLVDGGPPVAASRPAAPEAAPEDPRDEDPGYRAGAAAVQPSAPTDPHEAAVSLLESTLGARRIDRDTPP